MDSYLTPNTLVKHRPGGHDHDQKKHAGFDTDRQRVGEKIVQSSYNVNAKKQIENSHAMAERFGEQYNLTERDQENFEDILKTGTPVIAVPAGAIGKILAHGGFLSASGSEGDVMSMGGGQPKRKKWEQKQVGMSLDDSELPVYGFLDSPYGHLEEKEIGSWYGRLFFVPKPEVRLRTTFTVGDSGPGGVKAFTPLELNDHGYIFGTIGNRKKDSFWLYKDSFGGKPRDLYESLMKTNGYIEMQFHGGLSMDDIAEIRVPSNTSNRIIQSIVSKYPRIKITKYKPKLKSSFAEKHLPGQHDQDKHAGHSAAFSKTEFMPSDPNGSSKEQLEEIAVWIREAIEENPRRLLDPLWQEKGEQLEFLVTTKGVVPRPNNTKIGNLDWGFGIAMVHSHMDDQQTINDEDVFLWRKWVVDSKARISRLIVIHNDGLMETLEMTRGSSLDFLKATRKAFNAEINRGHSGAWSREDWVRGIKQLANKYGLIYQESRWKSVEKHLPDQHDQKTHGRKGSWIKVSRKDIEELSYEITRWRGPRKTIAEQALDDIEGGSNGFILKIDNEAVAIFSYSGVTEVRQILHDLRRYKTEKQIKDLGIDKSGYSVNFLATKKKGIGRQTFERLIHQIREDGKGLILQSVANKFFESINLRNASKSGHWTGDIYYLTKDDVAKYPNHKSNVDDEPENGCFACSGLPTTLVEHHLPGQHDQYTHAGSKYVKLAYDIIAKVASRLDLAKTEIRYVKGLLKREGLSGYAGKHLGNVVVVDSSLKETKFGEYVVAHELGHKVFDALTKSEQNEFIECFNSAINSKKVVDWFNRTIKNSNWRPSVNWNHKKQKIEGYNVSEEAWNKNYETATGFPSPLSMKDVEEFAAELYALQRVGNLHIKYGIEKHLPGQHDQKKHGNGGISQSDFAGEERTTERLRDKVVRDISSKWDVTEDELSSLAKEIESGQTKESVLQRIFGTWAGGSGDPSSTVAIRHVAKKLGIELSEYSVDDYLLTRPQLKSSLEKLGDAIYDHTQEWLAKHGVSEVKGYRVGKFEGRQFTSWSLGWGGARRVTGDEKTTVAIIPSKYIFSTAATGFGTLAESEFVAIGDQFEVEVEKHLPGRHDQDKHGRIGEIELEVNDNRITTSVKHYRKYEDLEFFNATSYIEAKIEGDLIVLLRAHTDEDYRRQGIATKLINAIRKRFPDHRIVTSGVYSSAGRALAESARIEERYKKHLVGRHDQRAHGNRDTLTASDSNGYKKIEGRMQNYGGYEIFEQDGFPKTGYTSPSLEQVASIMNFLPGEHARLVKRIVIRKDFHERHKGDAVLATNAFWHGDTNTIELFATPTSMMNWNRIDETIYHEVGHGVWNDLLTPMRQDTWQNIYSVNGGMIANDGVAEDFAEAYSHYMASTQMGNESKWLDKARFEYLNEWFPYGVGKHLPGRHDQKTHGRGKLPDRIAVHWGFTKHWNEGFRTGLSTTIGWFKTNMDAVGVVFDRNELEKDFGAVLGTGFGRRILRENEWYKTTDQYKDEQEIFVPNQVPLSKVKAFIANEYASEEDLEWIKTKAKELNVPVYDHRFILRKLGRQEKHLPGQHDQKTHGHLGDKSEYFPSEASAREANEKLNGTVEEYGDERWRVSLKHKKEKEDRSFQSSWEEKHLAGTSDDHDQSSHAGDDEIQEREITDLRKRHHIRREKVGEEKKVRTLKNGETRESIVPVFKYYDSISGNEIVDQSELDRFKSAAPPGALNVCINPDPDNYIVAIWTDTKGRAQGKFSKAHSIGAAAEKFERLKEFDKKLRSIRKKIQEGLVSDDPKEREAAAVCYLIERTAFRMGGTGDTKALVTAYGASTLLNKHVNVEGDKVIFDFIGKKGVRIKKSLRDQQLADLVSARKTSSWSDPLFRATPGQVANFFKKISGGLFTVKDFRTWHGTNIALKWIKKKSGPAPSEARFRKWQKEVAIKVASFLGNTPSISLSAYIDPHVWTPWRKTEWGLWVPKNLQEKSFSEEYENVYAEPYAKHLAGQHDQKAHGHEE